MKKKRILKMAGFSIFVLNKNPEVKKQGISEMQSYEKNFFLPGFL